jgi:hypothetical protein
MIELRVDANHLLLSYKPEGDSKWVSENFGHGETIKARNTFCLGAKDLWPSPDDEPQDESQDDPEYVFVLGELSGEYFKIKSHIVATKNTFYFHKSMQFEPSLFVAERKISILPKIDKLVSEDVYVGGPRGDAMPEDAYLDLIKKFPNSYELTKYASARVGACLRDYFESVSDSELLYQKYMNKRILSPGSDIIPTLRNGELAKYRTLLDRLKDMLASDAKYNERQWQAEILDIILLLYPKYIHAFREAPVRDPISKKKRRMDFLLVDSCGNIDLIEIKQPFDNCIVSKRQYRDNYIPTKELSGTVMQLEKYIFYLNKWGQRGEDWLSKRYRDQLPRGLRLKIINPKGIIIMGRENTLSTPQRDDFEIIKRKYASVIDIVTYDDLLRRLGVTISQLEASVDQS